MTMLKGISVSIFLLGCVALYLSVLALVNPTVPGATNFVDTRVAYSMTIAALALFCCVIAGLTWSRASRMTAGTAVIVSLALSIVFLAVVCVRLGAVGQLPL